MNLLNNFNNRTLIVAELSANHNQNINIAKKTIKAAKESGADAIKIQTYTAETLTLDCNNKYFKIKGTIWDGKTLFELYKQAFTPWEWHFELKKFAEDLGLIFFSTPFDKTAVDFLEELNIPLYKIASFEITDIPLIEYIASKNKPIIISTGIATLQEIEEAIDACSRQNNKKITLLKCTSQYPAKIEDANLLTIPDLKRRFNVNVGLSDHTLSPVTAITAAAIGANVIEKHLILNKKIGGPDAAFSITPNEFKFMADSIREVEKCLGSINYDITQEIQKSRKFARSIFVVNDINKGELFSEENIKSIRPGDGLPPKYMKEVIGKKATKKLKKGTPLKWADVS